MADNKKKRKKRLAVLRNRVTRLYNRALLYWNEGIWRDNRNVWWVNVLKTINLSVRSFTNTDLQSQACAMTYRTALAIIPALAMLFAIGRGFGFQRILEEEISALVPGQQAAFGEVLNFADAYLNHSSEGLFVGVGLAFLLWTLISLISNVENTFNRVFGVKQGRSLWRKISDYTAALLILPILMICASGLNIFVSSTLQHTFYFSFMSPMLSWILEAASWIFTWLFFALLYILIPNTRVKVPNALLAGVFAGTGFRILQWLFVSGQLYVTKYNAIYGSFAFIPLMLIWLQLTWMVVLCGALICYSSQNIFLFAFSTQVSDISLRYRRRVTLAVATLIVQRFQKMKTPPTQTEITHHADIPPRLLSDIIDDLIKAEIIVVTVLDNKREIHGYVPACNVDKLTLSYVWNKLDILGRQDFIPRFDKHFESVVRLCDSIELEMNQKGMNIKLSDLSLGLSLSPDKHTITDIKMPTSQS